MKWEDGADVVARTRKPGPDGHAMSLGGNAPGGAHSDCEATDPGLYRRVQITLSLAYFADRYNITAVRTRPDSD